MTLPLHTGGCGNGGGGALGSHSLPPPSFPSYQQRYRKEFSFLVLTFSDRCSFLHYIHQLTGCSYFSWPEIFQAGIERALSCLSFFGVTGRYVGISTWESIFSYQGNLHTALENERRLVSSFSFCSFEFYKITLGNLENFQLEL